MSQLSLGRAGSAENRSPTSSATETQKLTSNALSAHLSWNSSSSGAMKVATSFEALAERMLDSETFLKPSFSRTSSVGWRRLVRRKSERVRERRTVVGDVDA